MGYVKRKCDVCGKEYCADERNLKRGWGLCCSKSCAAKKREMSKPGYDPERVKRNNIRRKNWNNSSKSFRGYTVEGYRILGHTAYNEFDNPVYDIDLDAGEYDDGDDEYWNDKEL